MKGNIGKLALLIVPIIIAGYLLYPTYRAWDLEKKRETLSNAKDSVALANFDKDNLETLREAKKKRIKLGLDLRGGIYVTLEVDVIKLLQESADKEAVDDLFLQVLDETRKQTETGDESVIDVFLRNFNAIARPKGRSLVSYFEVSGSRNASEEEIITKLRANSAGAIDQAMEVIRQRIDKYGVGETTIQKQGSRRLTIELPGVSNEGEVRQLIQTTARLEFKLVRNNGDLVRAFYQIDQFLKARNKGVTTDSAAMAKNTVPADSAKADSTAKAKDTTAVAKTDTVKKDSAQKDPYAGLSDEERRKRIKEDYPFTSLFISYFISNEQFVPINYMKNEFPDGEYFFQIPDETVAEFQKIIAMPTVRKLLGSELDVAVSAKPETRRGENQSFKIYTMWGLKAESELTGDVVSEARATFDPSTNTPMVLMDMSAEGAERWARITGANIKKKIAIVLDGRVYSAPVVQNKITGGRSQITGSSSIDEARLLEIVLKAGALKAPVKIIEERVVGPSLGEDSINSGLTASAIAVILVILFMVAYYVTAGAVADIAVMINVLLMISLLAAFGGTLTLPGIGGIILTIGMAVDANILIYERIREELHRGRTLQGAIDEGFSKALAAILDSNITTFITGVILFYFGSGPVQGFAVTLMIGIIMTLFTAILVSRAMFDMMLSRGATKINFG